MPDPELRPRLRREALVNDRAIPYLLTLIEVAVWAKGGFPEDPAVEDAIEWANSVLDDLGAPAPPVPGVDRATARHAHDDDVDRRIDLRREDRDHA